MKPLTTLEAKKQQLPHSDTYRRAHIIYLDDMHRDWAAVELNREARRAFADTIVISERRALAAHRAAVAEFLAGGGLTEGHEPPWSEVTGRHFEFHNYEHLKIATGFELHLKARLLSAGYVVHCLKTRDARYASLGKAQTRRPVHRDELRAIEDFHFDGTHNYLPGLAERSLNFSLLTDCQSYRDRLGLETAELDIAQDYRNLRNEIHLPGELPETPAIKAFGRPIVEFLLPFINEKIVGWSNALIAHRGLKMRPLSDLA